MRMIEFLEQFIKQYKKVFEKSVRRKMFKRREKSTKNINDGQ